MSHYEMETEAYEYGPHEFEYETGETGETGELQEFHELESPLHEVQEMELASELLEITNEQELEEFLGKLFRGVTRAVGGIIRSPIGRALGGILKNVAKQALPVVGGALGSFVAPGVGTAIGSRLGSMAGNLFELELEGMDREQAEFEVARRYVQLAASAARNAALAPPNVPPQRVAQQAVAAAAQRFAPGLLGMGLPGAYAAPAGGTYPAPAGGGYYGAPYTRPRSGRWVRRGRKIIVLGV
jgi:uncharacterized protein (DUF697 family)